jgi:hypothetical protein
MDTTLPVINRIYELYKLAVGSASALLFMHEFGNKHLGMSRRVYYGKERSEADEARVSYQSISLS